MDNQPAADTTERTPADAGGPPPDATAPLAARERPDTGEGNPPIPACILGANGDRGDVGANGACPSSPGAVDHAGELESAATVASDAFRKLQAQLEAVRREAYAEGFNAAVATIRAKLDSVAEPTSSPVGSAADPPARADAPAPAALVPAADGSMDEQYRTRIPRGLAARLVEEVLKSQPQRAMSPREIERRLEAMGRPVPSTTVRRGLAILEERGAAAEESELKIWRYKGGGT